MDKTFLVGAFAVVAVIVTFATSLTTFNIHAMETQKVLMSKCIEAKSIWIANTTSSYGGHCINKD
jgi:hypothetical protein